MARKTKNGAGRKPGRPKASKNKREKMGGNRAKKLPTLAGQKQTARQKQAASQTQKPKSKSVQLQQAGQLNWSELRALNRIDIMRDAQKPGIELRANRDVLRNFPIRSEGEMIELLIGLLGPKVNSMEPGDVLEVTGIREPEIKKIFGTRIIVEPAGELSVTSGHHRGEDTLRIEIVDRTAKLEKRIDELERMVEEEMKQVAEKLMQKKKNESEHEE